MHHDSTRPDRRVVAGERDFDFLHGTWNVHNHRLRRPLSGTSDWYQFAGRSVERPLWGGNANIEEYEATLPDGEALRGLALRLYDPHAKRWTIHWSNFRAGTLDAPMIGSFVDGVGTFYGYEDYQGRRVFVRFLWRATGSNEARWEQAFSIDGGRSWETNWIMEFTRARSAASRVLACQPHSCPSRTSPRPPRLP